MSTSQGSDQGSPGSSRYGRGRVGGGGYKPPPPAGDEYGTKPTPGDPTPPDDGYEPETPPEPRARARARAGPEPEGYGPEDTSYAEPETSEPDGEETPEPPTEPPSSHPCPPSMTCDTRGIDDLQCQAKGVKAESKAYDEVAAALDARRQAFETARAKYTEAREHATRAKKDLKRDIEALLHDTRCDLNRDVAECIDDAFGQVLECLDECPEDVGCCVDCSFEHEEWTVDQIDGLRVRVEKAEKCFDEVLVKEPEALTKRVEDLQKWVQELKDARKPEADPKEEPERLYARAKRLGWLLDTIWGRFADANKYQDCLCCGLQCSLQGRQWLAELAGEKAYQECQEASRLRRCDWLRAQYGRRDPGHVRGVVSTWPAVR